VATVSSEAKENGQMPERTTDSTLSAVWLLATVPIESRAVCSPHCNIARQNLGFFSPRNRVYMLRH